jgi:hypothetical protein
MVFKRQWGSHVYAGGGNGGCSSKDMEIPKRKPREVAERADLLIASDNSAAFPEVALSEGSVVECGASDRALIPGMASQIMWAETKVACVLRIQTEVIIYCLRACK